MIIFKAKSSKILVFRFFPSAFVSYTIKVLQQTGWQKVNQFYEWHHLTTTKFELHWNMWRERETLTIGGKNDAEHCKQSTRLSFTLIHCVEMPIFLAWRCDCIELENGNRLDKNDLNRFYDFLCVQAVRKASSPSHVCLLSGCLQ